MSDEIGCETCKYDKYEDCFDVVGVCDGFDKWKPINTIEGNPFNTQVSGNHYKTGADKGVMDPAEWCMNQNLGFGEGNVLKYVFRHENKGGIEDLKKAMQYLRFVAWVKYNKVLE